ncbi:hypothetical protein LINPERHAP2_LOCUS39003 [Linum perenne]
MIADIFCWNCCGAGHKSFLTCFKEYANSYNFAAAIIVEPKSAMIKQTELLISWGFLLISGWMQPGLKVACGSRGILLWFRLILFSRVNSSFMSKGVAGWFRIILLLQCMLALRRLKEFYCGILSEACRLIWMTPG